MSNSAELQAFVKAAKEQGATDEFLVALLRDKGWPAKEVYAVFGQRTATAALKTTANVCWCCVLSYSWDRSCPRNWRRAGRSPVFGVEPIFGKFRKAED